MLHTGRSPKNRSFRYWYDENIRAGDNWNKKIEHAVNHCEIAICLISKDFLDSDFIREKEIPIFLEKGIKIIPILVGSCGWKTVPWLKKIQFINGTTPLSESKPEEHDDIFSEILNEIDQLNL